MEPVVIESEKGFCTLDMEAAERLRDAIKTNYSMRGGKRNLGDSKPATYQELAKHITNWLATNGWVVKYHGKGGSLTKADVAPTFLKHLFYNNPRTKKHDITGHLFSVDMCYLYAYGQTHAEYGAQLNEPVKVVFNGRESDQFTLLVVTVSATGREAVKVKSTLEGLMPGAKVTVVYRDLASARMRTLADIFEADENRALVFWLVGKDYLQHEACAAEVCGLATSAPDLLRTRTVSIFLDDVCSGDFCLTLTSGRLRFIQFWREQLDAVRSLMPSEGSLLATATGSPSVQSFDRTVEGISRGMVELMAYFGDGVRSARCDHFVQRFGPQDIEQLFDGMIKPE